MKKYVYTCVFEIVYAIIKLDMRRPDEIAQEMAASKAKRREPISARVNKRIKEQLKQIAEGAQITLAVLVENILTDYLKEVSDYKKKPDENITDG